MAQHAEHDAVSQLAAGSRSESYAAADDGSARRWLILGVVCLAQLMVVLDATVVNIALPLSSFPAAPPAPREAAAAG